MRITGNTALTTPETAAYNNSALKKSIPLVLEDTFEASNQRINRPVIDIDIWEQPIVLTRAINYDVDSRAWVPLSNLTIRSSSFNGAIPPDGYAIYTRSFSIQNPEKMKVIFDKASPYYRFDEKTFTFTAKPGYVFNLWEDVVRVNVSVRSEKDFVPNGAPEF